MMSKTLKETLIQTISLIAIAAAINFVFYFFANRGGREVLQVSQVFSFLCAIPIIVGLIISYFLVNSRNLLLKIIHIVLLIGNGFLLIFSVVLILVGASFSPMALLTLLYIGIGGYVYFKTIEVFKMHKKAGDFTFSDSDVLDDDFIINE